jgi:chromosome segregation ATPase
MNAKTSLDAKEKIKNDFNNVNGTIKVIIGSETIAEGVSLNGNTVALYNTFLGWNPTESIQVEGRAWRQGNEQGHVHIVYPLMNDSVDSVMYQKHDEKGSRLNDLYSYKGDKLNVEDINAEELKFSLIKDPEKRAKFKVDVLKVDVDNKRSTLQAQVDILVKNAKRVKQAESEIGSYDDAIKESEQELVETKVAYAEAKAEVDKVKKEKKKLDWSLERRLEREKYNVDRIKNSIREYKGKRKSAEDAIDTINAKFDKMGIKKEADIQRKEKEMLKEIQVYNGQIEQIEKDRAKYIEEARRQIAAESEEVPPIEKLIKQNVASIVNDLRPMMAVKPEIEAERAGMRKSILVFKRRRAA